MNKRDEKRVREIAREEVIKYRIEEYKFIARINRLADKRSGIKRK